MLFSLCFYPAYPVYLGLNLLCTWRQDYGT
jgi:hypothetical protein